MEKFEFPNRIELIMLDIWAFFLISSSSFLFAKYLQLWLTDTFIFCLHTMKCKIIHTIQWPVALTPTPIDKTDIFLFACNSWKWRVIFLVPTRCDILCQTILSIKKRFGPNLIFHVLSLLLAVVCKVLKPSAKREFSVRGQRPAG